VQNLTSSVGEQDMFSANLASMKSSKRDPFELEKLNKEEDF